MKTTLVLPDALVVRLKQEAERVGQSMSSVTEAALRRYLAEAKPGRELPELPSVAAGVPMVDLDDRDALIEAMEDD